VTAQDFDALLAEGMAVDVEAYWGAGFLAGRHLPGEVSWRWPDLVQPCLNGASRLLDMGTGEGSALLSLAPLPGFTVAYEEWQPTVPAALATLRPHGVHLVVCLGADDNTASQRNRPGLPFAAGAFDVVVSRHEAFDAAEVRRLLRPGGWFVTQQVGGKETDSTRALLALPPQGPSWDLQVASAQVTAAGMVVAGAAEELPTTGFTDVAALVAYLRSTPWAVPELDPVAMRERLGLLHERCAREGSVSVVGHRFWLRARAPG